MQNTNNMPKKETKLKKYAKSNARIISNKAK